MIPINVGIKVGSYRTIERVARLWRETAESESKRDIVSGAIVILVGAYITCISTGLLLAALGFLLSMAGLLMMIWTIAYPPEGLVETDKCR